MDSLEFRAPVAARVMAVLVALVAAMLIAAPGAWADEGDDAASEVLLEEIAEDTSVVDEGDVAEDAASEPETELASELEPEPEPEPVREQELETPLPAEDAAPPADDPAAPAEDSAAAAPVEKRAAGQPAQPTTPPKRVSTTDSADKTQTAGNAGSQAVTDTTSKDDKDAARTVADGIYWIRSYAAPAQAIGIADDAKKAGAAAQLAKRAKGVAAQKWKIVWKNGSYEIVNLNSGRALAVASKKAGAKVVQAKRKNVDAQRWTIELSADGKQLVFRNVLSGKVLNIAGSAKAGAALNALKANKKKTQFFTLKKANAVDEGTYKLFSAKSAKKALNVEKAKKSAQPALAKKEDALAQNFYIRNEADGRYSIQSVASGMFLAAVKGKVVLRAWSDAQNLLWDGDYDKGLVFQNAKTGKVLAVAKSKAVALDAAPGKAQRWNVAATQLLAEGAYTLGNAAGGNLEVQGGSYKKGANVRVSAEAGAKGAQCFELQQEGNAYRLVNLRTFQAVAAASGKAGANVGQRKPGEGKAELWKVSINRDGSIAFTNAKSGQALRVSGKKGNVTIGKATGAATQGWTLTATERYSLSGNEKLDKRVAAILANHGSLRSAFNYVAGFKYREGKRFWGGSRYLSNGTTINYANDMVSHHSGNCYRFASLFSWLARGLGYSTKVVSGWVPSAAGGRAPHGWVEVKSGGKTRVCDPDLRHEIPGHNWYMVSYGGAPISYGRW